MNPLDRSIRSRVEQAETEPGNELGLMANRLTEIESCLKATELARKVYASSYGPLAFNFEQARIQLEILPPHAAPYEGKTDPETHLNK